MSVILVVVDINECCSLRGSLFFAIRCVFCVSP